MPTDQATVRSVIPYYLEQDMHMDEGASWRKVIQN